MLLTPYLRTFCALILISPYSLANDSAPLPLGVVLDDQGQPLTIPTQPKTALSYTPIKPSKTSKTHKPLPSKPKAKAKKISRKQQLANRKTVANDAGCRWLNSRMNLLEKNLNLGVNHRNMHHQQELNVRQEEWECLKCGMEGPDQADHHSCQYRR
ncbi:hypothetical protein JK628_00900 [Shewanella sp. KX20019]|uniref:hypothetical protein n=1 Tax=Shewanella sp. KX20019 TaxID=2803864 RepID=UPI0019287549|nr:hypothetical protein [Shewanella sp. KX20019]QQX80472.1 hypothetical protein JK628_00900 [Shewanella sp. KX20019]